MNKIGCMTLMFRIKAKPKDWINTLKVGELEIISKNVSKEKNIYGHVMGITR